MVKYIYISGPIQQLRDREFVGIMLMHSHVSSTHTPQTPYPHNFSSIKRQNIYEMPRYPQVFYNCPTKDQHFFHIHIYLTHFLSTLLWKQGKCCGPLKITIFPTSTFNPLSINSSLEIGEVLWPTKDQHFIHINISPTSHQLSSSARKSPCGPLNIGIS